MGNRKKEEEEEGVGPFSRTQELRTVRTSPYAGGVKGRIDMTGDRGRGGRKKDFFLHRVTTQRIPKEKRYCSKKNSYVIFALLAYDVRRRLNAGYATFAARLVFVAFPI